MTRLPHPTDEELEPLITECPSCLTRFRASEAQLQRAGGKVRCGACLTVFNGVEHLTLESAQVFADDDHARQALDDVLDELGGEADADANLPELAQPDVGARRTPPRGPIFAGYEDDEDDADDAQETQGAQETQEARAESPAPPDSARAVAAGLEREEPDVDCSFEIVGDRDLAESDQPGDDGFPTAGADPGAVVKSLLAAKAAAASSARSEPAARTAVKRPQDPPSGAPRPRSSGDRVTEGAVDAAAATEPVRFGEEPVRRPLVWVGIGVGLLLLVAQVLWYQFDDWANDPAGRAVYAPLCAVLGCELPQQRDLALLATRNLAVRINPDRPGMLLVNAVIVNEADFAQPFPVLELRFTTVRGMLVAGRRFQPQDYLAGDAVGMTLIPPRTPVQIELTIDDPGPEAVNYFLRFI
ncbi:MAG: DUF3426 domain-containing protein [Pseudomonadales bacterium]